MKVAIISGSARIGNNTLRVARAMKQQIQNNGHTAVITDFQEYDLPFINAGSLAPGQLSSFQEQLIGNIDEAQLVIIITPEYNWFPSAELVNMVHQLGTKAFRHLFENKVFAFCGVSTGRGGRMPTVQLSYVFDKIFNVFNTHSITCPKKFESQFTTQVLDADGNSMGNAEYDKGLSAFLEYALQTTARWVGSN